MESTKVAEDADGADKARIRRRGATLVIARSDGEDLRRGPRRDAEKYRRPDESGSSTRNLH